MNYLFKSYDCSLCSGLTRYGEEILTYRPLPKDTPISCPSPMTCFIMDPSLLLHAGISYYFSLFATNRAGLSSLLTSSVSYKYTSATPTVGLVLDFDPSSEVKVVDGSSYHMADIDVLLEGETLGLWWRGFAHSSLPINYHVSLGSAPGMDDIVSSTSIEIGVYQYTFFQLPPLVEGATYYSTVTAATLFGMVNVSSNGVLFLGNLTSVKPQTLVYDGLGEVDVDYQTSTSHITAQWFFPNSVHAQISHYMWGLVQVQSSQEIHLQDMGSASGSGLDDTVHQVVREFVHVGKDKSGVLSLNDGLEIGGVLYMNAIRACFATHCLPPVYSNGFYISSPPNAGPLSAIYSPSGGINAEYGTSSQGKLDLRWIQFVDLDLTYYEWRLMSDVSQLVSWQHIEKSEQVSVVINVTLTLHHSISAQLRIYNSVGLHITSTAELEWNVDGSVLPHNSVPHSPLQVFDVLKLPSSSESLSDWRELTYLEAQVLDIDYINSTYLSGVWPHLRYKTYNYSISTLQAYMPSSDAAGIACGSTFLNHASLTSPDLQDGQTYYFCVRALQEHAIHPTSSTPSVLEVCSNGVTIDLLAPRGSCFKIVSPLLEGVNGGQRERNVVGASSSLECSLRNDSLFQVSDSELYLSWSEFVDSSEVAYYSCAIGEFSLNTA